jgi:hypothetical protein
MRVKTCSKNGNEKCIHFRQELEWKKGFLRTRYRGETITMNNKQFVPNPVRGTPLLPPHAFMVFTEATLLFPHSIQRRALVSTVANLRATKTHALFTS